MREERVISTRTGLVVVADQSEFKRPGHKSPRDALDDFAAKVGTSRVAVFRTGGNGQFKLRLESSDRPVTTSGFASLRSSTGTLAVPTGTLVVGGPEALYRSADRTIVVPPGVYRAEAHIMDHPAPEPRRDIFDSLGPFLSGGSFLAIFAAIVFAGARAWDLLATTIGFTVAVWTAYLLAFNLSGAAKRQAEASKHDLDEGPPDFVLRLIPASDGSEPASGCDVEV